MITASVSIDNALPGIVPTVRDYDMGQWPQGKMKMRNGRVQRWGLSSIPTGDKMRLVWENITYAQAESLCIVWDQNYGIYGEVLLPPETLAGTSEELAALLAGPFAGATWQFSAPPKVVAVKARRCTVEMPISVRGFVRQDLDIGDGIPGTYDGCNICEDDDDCSPCYVGGGDPDAPFTFIEGGDINNPNVGDTLTTTSTCSGARIRYYRDNPAAPGGRVYLSEGPTYTLGNDDVGYSVYSEVECPDPSSPTGYDEPIPSNPSGPPTFGGFNPYIYNYYRLRNPLNGGVSGWHLVERNAPPRLLTNSFGINTAHCPACGTPQSSPAPSTVAIWSADGRSSVSVAYAANSTGYAQVWTYYGLFLYESPWAYNDSGGGINCYTAPVCSSGKGGATASWEFTNNNVTGIVLNTWGGTDSGYEDLTE